jgi:hypothetical protein
MWNYLKGCFRSGKFSKNIRWSLLTAAMIIAVIKLALWGVLLLGLPTYGVFMHTIKTFKMNTAVPYWGEKFKKKDIFKLLAEEKFHPYVTKKGKKVRQVKVSDSGRWVCVKGRYYPLPLIRRFCVDRDLTKCVVYMIDGNCDEQEWTGSAAIEEALEEMCNDDQNYPDHICATVFEMLKGQLLKDDHTLATTDWNEFRYNWEQKCRVMDNGQDPERVSAKRMRALTNPESNNKTMFNKALSANEIQAICDGIKDGRIDDPGRMANINKYKKDIYVLNGVKIYENLGYPANKVAEEFLFDCIRDIEKPYFDDALRVLSEFPREHLIGSIEKHVKKAHEKGDYVFGAGLLALARAIDYEISLEKESSETEALSEISSENSNEVTGFEAVAEGGQGAVAVKFQV